jgi:hypothetical protein
MPLTKIQSLGITDGTIVNADINASAAIAGTKLSNLNDAKAWINFDGTGTPAIRASFNVTSITDTGTGNYTLNFTNALTDANYVVAGSVRTPATTTGGAIQPETYNTTSLAFYTINLGGTLTDFTQTHIAIFR